MSSWDTEEGFAEDLLDDDDEEEDIPGVQVTTESLPYNYTYLPHKGTLLTSHLIVIYKIIFAESDEESIKLLKINFQGISRKLL